ncbi:MAG: hypothetical protein ABSE64_13965 [Vulcanimicrobiaceae bacterium]|jgi:hypothetical protein
MPALTPDIAFEQAANAAAAAWAARPAYVTYVTHTHIEAPSMHQSLKIDRLVSVRSADDAAILKDLPDGGQSMGRAFPISPTFDALAYFRLNTNVNWHKQITTSITGPDGSGSIIPITFKDPKPSDNEVVVTSLRFYYPKFAPDSSDAPDGHMHITMTALPTLTNGNGSDFYINDVVIDNATMLPLSVTYIGKDDRTFKIDYGFVGKTWIVKHAFFEQTVYSVLHVSRLHYTADATFEDYQFSDTSPDPRIPLLATPAPTASPSA